MNYEQKAREIAHEMFRQTDRLRCSPVGHTLACNVATESIAAALRSVAEEVRERAAKVTDEHTDDDNPLWANCASYLGQLIRSLPVGED